jgi:SAM-dependent methyltransferase
MADLKYRIDDLGDRRVLTLEGRTYPPTRYSKRVIEMLVERKQERAPLYFPFKETRGPLYLDPLLRWLRAHGARDLAVLEVGCSFGHMTEYLAEQREIATIDAFDTDPKFVEIARAKLGELQLDRVREVRLFSNDETRRLPWPDGAFDLVLAIGVVEHLPRDRRAQVNEYYRVLAPGGHIAILDTPNRLFPLETHSIGLPLVQWMSPPLAFRYARLCRPRKFRGLGWADFVADGIGWRNASLAECLPSSRWAGLEDLTEAAGYGWRFFRDTARSRTRRAVLPLFAPLCAALAVAGRPPSLALPYFNLLFRKTRC